MPDNQAGRPAASAEPDLAALALLCAAGELEGPDAAAFEGRLAQDQAAREALAQAVLLSQTLAGRPAPRPDPAYRGEVLRRLRPRGRQAARRALWAALGAAAAVLVMLALPRTSPQPPPVASSPAPPAAAEGPSLDEALAWSALTSSVHLEQAIEELHRRRDGKGPGGTGDPRGWRLIGQQPTKH